jgi:alginate O-acetyltransferase complex protein AlgI
MEVRPTNELERWNGLKLIIIGYFKKVVLADNIAPMVNSGFANIHLTDNGPFWWVMIIGFSFQIYFDFSGYSDIARGLAKWMGLHFRLNFNHPYHSRSLREFWTRWHISLSTWFRDYVYIPLGGSRKGRWNAHLFMWITMASGTVPLGPSLSGEPCMHSIFPWKGSPTGPSVLKGSQQGACSV